MIDLLSGTGRGRRRRARITGTWDHYRHKNWDDDGVVPVDLHAALTAMIGSGAEPIGPITRTPLDYDAFHAGRQVTRLHGDALVQDRRRPWSLIEKTTSAPGVASEDLTALAHRELMAFRSGRLAGDGPGLRAVTAHRAVEHPDGATTLFLEDLGEREWWSMERFADAARDLGRFNGRWLDHVPEDPWLFRGWVERHSQPHAIDQGRSIIDERLEAARAALGDIGRSEAQRLLDDQPTFEDALGTLPVMLCHHDAVRSNLSWRAGRTVAIDWELVGPGPVGADLASLLFSSGRRGDLPVEWLPELRPEATAAYCAGLAEAGAAVTEAEVQRGFDAAVSLRWSLLRDVVVLATSDGPGQVRGSVPDESRDESVRQLALLTTFLLEAAGRVRQAR